MAGGRHRFYEADAMAYIKWSSYGDTKGVNPDDIE
jgi:hypothetical protein